jgi:3-deoxy-D-manno-octulosonic acid kinase
MNIETLIDQGKAIVYDRDVITDPEPGLFQPSYWRSLNSVAGSAVGRGEAYFLETPFGAVVLRRYRRGGWAARFSEDRYLFTGFERSRPFREFHLLAKMSRRGLPVPQPLAAFCERAGIHYGGALMTRRIPNVVALADGLAEGLAKSRWEAIGRCIRRFHAAGVNHADLNARNILLQEGGEGVFLIDFDRGTISQNGAIDGKTNLARLHRSLVKCWPKAAARTLPDCWTWLSEAYRA